MLTEFRSRGSRLRNLFVLSLVFGLGYLAGHGGLPQHVVAHAIDEDDEAVQRSDEAIAQVRAVVSAAQSAAAVMENESLYKAATRGVNVFAASAGGTNAISDLEDGRGVDPETFAALYAERWTDEVKPHIGRDELGRLTYKGKLIRLYSQQRLKSLFTTRDSLAGGI